MTDMTSNAMNGHVTGTLIQARGITLHLPPPPALPVPAQLPRPAARRPVDRVVESARLTRWHSTGQADLVVVTGDAGIGKTTLTLWWATTQADTFVDGRLHADFAAEPDLTGEVVLRRWLRALGIAPTAIPSHPVEVAALWRSLTHDRHLLLVLDGAHTADQVLPLLPASPHALTLVTTRHHLPELITAGARPLHLGVLPSHAARDLLAAFAGQTRAAREPEHLHRLAALCQGHPLTAVLLGGHLAAHPELPIAAVVDHAHTLTALSWSIAMRMADHDLPPADRDLLGVLRHVGGPGLSADTVGMLDLSDHDVDRALRRLVDRGLLQQVTDPTGAVRYPATPAPEAVNDDTPVDQSGSSGDSSPTLSQPVTQALTRLVAHYAGLMSSIAETLEPGKHAYSPLRQSATPFSDRGAARTVFDREHRTAMTMLPLAVDLGLPDFAWQLGEALWIPLRSGRHTEDVLTSQTLAAHAAHHLEHPYESTALARIAWAQSWLGRPADALVNVEQATAVARHHDDDRALATALSVWAQALIADDQLEAAVAMFDRCIDLDIRTGARPWVLGLRLRQQAPVLNSLGRPDQACRAARFAVGLILGDPRPRGFEAARALIVHAEILLDLGLVQLADDALIHADTLLDPDADRVHHADVQALLWQSATRLGHPDAEQHRARAIAAYDLAGHPQRAAELREHPDTAVPPAVAGHSDPPPSDGNREQGTRR
ncbi:helix-turn-helix domain-containing protein [Umezawaea sp. Da 62-37]|uniref:helix-turn-helix domain-containing protein n=1 Tax=Umezawaea sp. Da 62-37 TaxID=3075927 RepID=UPI0028F724AE|nr:helix-turn-helix domain-containing protein [Umezawaea sp. Da 62-37]WNV85025.1 helix-turn-helix domain-containing protein [Umezawaea sp. Da 62-37]